MDYQEIQKLLEAKWAESEKPPEWDTLAKARRFFSSPKGRVRRAITGIGLSAHARKDKWPEVFTIWRTDRAMERVLSATQQWWPNNLTADERGIFYGRVLNHLERFFTTLDVSHFIEDPTAEPYYYSCSSYPPATMPFGEVLWLDGALLRYLRDEVAPACMGRSTAEREVGEQMQADLETWEQEARDRWSRWTGYQQTLPFMEPWQAELDLFDWWVDPYAESSRDELGQPCRWVRMFALAVWNADAGPKVDAKRAKPPALPALFVEPVTRSLVSSRLQEGRIVDDHGRETSFALVAGVPDDIVSQVADGAHLLGTLTAQRLIRWLPKVGVEQYIAGRPDPGRVDIEGGWAGLAEMVGAKSGKARSEIPALVKALRGLTLRWDGPDRRGEINAFLDGYEEPKGITAATRDRRALVTLFLSRTMLPGFVFDVQNGVGRRRLVPILDVPPMGTLSRNLHPAVARLDLFALLYLSQHSQELATYGGVLMPWEELSIRSGLDPCHLLRVQDIFTTDSSEGDARWARVGKDRWTLADREHTRAALHFLEEGGRASIGGAKGGRKRVERKNARRKP